MNIGDMYAYIDRVVDSVPVRMTAVVVRVDNPGEGLETPQITCYVFPTGDDASRFGVPFEASSILVAFGSNATNTFEPIHA